jgi:hypothetical protein
MIKNKFTETMLTADGFDKAIVGVVAQSPSQEGVVAYDYELCIKILMDRDGMTWGEAIDFFDYNVLGSFMGPETPIFVHMGTLDADYKDNV